jgi:hypothetical protein
MAGGALLLAACGPESVATPPPQLVRPYWRPALQGAADAIEVTRQMESNTQAFAAGLISLRQYALALGRYGTEIGDIGRALAQLEPPSDARDAHQSLLESADALTLSAAKMNAYLEDEDLRQVVVAVDDLKRARAALGSFVAAIEDPGSRTAMEQQLNVLGEIEFRPNTVNRFAVLVGEFGSAVEARARLGRFDPDAELSSRYRGWAEVGRFAGAEEALQSAADWDARGFRVRVEPMPDIQIDVSISSPALSHRDWRELIWFHDLEFDPIAVAASGDAAAVATISRSGRVAAIGFGGSRLWDRDLNFPADGIAVNRDGSLTAGFGFFVAPLDRQGEPVWPHVKDQSDNQIVDQVEFAGDSLLLARSVNNRGEGGAFMHRTDGLKWRLDAGPHSRGIGSARLSLDGSLLAIATGGASPDHAVSFYQVRDDDLGDEVTFLRNSFATQDPISDLALSGDGGRIVLSTGNALEIRSTADGRLLHRVPMEVVNMEPDPLGRIVYVTTPAALSAIGMDGQTIWQNLDLAPRRIAASNNYVATVTEASTISVLTSTGELLGDATTLAPVRAIALAEDVDILIAASAEQRLQAWQLPGRALVPRIG